MMPLLSPVSGAPLEAEGDHLLRDAHGRFWPVLDGIPFLRIGRDALVEQAVRLIRSGDLDGARVVLLADQDDWWNGVTPDPDALARLVRERDGLTLRDAMERLCFDRVGHYFAHRWTDPTFLAGLGLLEAHWRPAETAFELACGIGHFGRELALRGTAFTGGDVVFSKLWLARHWVLPTDATLICFDAAAPWPVAGRRFDLAFCHDAFYFLEPKAEILASLRRLMAPSGRLALSHIHNSGAANLSAGRAVSADDMARLFPGAAFYDDAELTRAVATGRRPQAKPLADLAGVEAFSVEDRPAGSARVLEGGLARPRAGAALRLNPLYAEREAGALEVAWPSLRYEAEYGGLATYPSRLSSEEADRARNTDEAVCSRILVDLPERW